MFIISAKLNPRKAIAFVILLGVFFIAVILLVRVLQHREIPSEKLITAATEEERVEYLRTLGWEIEPSPSEILQFFLPQPLSTSYQEYNTLQLEQGFDLTPYAGMSVKRYSYTVTNHPDYSQNVQADLYLCGDVIIGGDILYSGEGSFVASLVYPG